MRRSSILLMSLALLSCSTQCERVSMLEVTPMVVLDLPERPTLEETDTTYSNSAKSVLINLIKLSTYADQLESVIQEYNKTAIQQNTRLYNLIGK